MRLSVRLDKLLAPGNRHLQEQLIFCMRNWAAPRYSCLAPLAWVCTKPQGLFRGLSLPIEAAKHKQRLPTLESRSFNPPVQKVLSNRFGLNPFVSARERQKMLWKRVKYFSLELLFTRNLRERECKEKEEESRERELQKKKLFFSLILFSFTKDPTRGLG